MSRGLNQKLKLPYLMKIMLEKTDDEHALNMAQIIQELGKYDVAAERKSIYNDFDEMTDRFGIEIIKEQVGRDYFYHVGSREFELAEVKLLIDAIQSSKFITEKKSRVLITKIKKLVSEHQAKQLQRQVYINDRAKTMNESIFYNVDFIHTAINSNKKIKFNYYRWNVEKELEPMHDGADFVVSPWALTWNDENYYLVAFDDYSETCRHYRVDKMMHIEIIDREREGKEEFGKLDMASYSQSTFGMYSGRFERVQITFPNRMVGVFIDRFGQEISVRPVDEEHSKVSVNVAVSPQFFGWITSLGPEVKVTGPAEVVKEIGDYIREIANMY